MPAMHRWTGALAALTLTCAAPLAAAQDATLGRTLAATCANCHGTDGHARGGSVSLAGMPAADLQNAFAEFKAGKRPATIMHQIAKGYTDEQVRLIAAYFAAQRKD